MSVEPVASQVDVEEPAPPAEKSNLPSTSQEPSSSSAGTVELKACFPLPLRGSPEWIIGLHLTLSFVSTFVFVDTSTAPPKSSRPGPSRQLQRWPESRGGRWKRGGLISLWTHCTTFLMRLGVFINDGKALFHYIFYSHCTFFLHRFNIFLFCNIFYINRSGLSFSRVPRETLRQIEQQVENHTEGTASSLLHFIRHNRFVVTLVFIIVALMPVVFLLYLWVVHAKAVCFIKECNKL